MLSKEIDIELIKQLTELAREAVDSGRIQVNTVEDFCTLVELSLLLLN